MYATAINLCNLLLAALLVGAMFGVWLTFNPAGLSFADYVTMQQRAIRGLNVFMPVLGAVTLLLTIAAAIFARDDKTRVALLGVAAICLLFAGLVTRFLNQPINKVVMSWPINVAPANWTELRDAWWRWHRVRLIFGVIGLGLLILDACRRTVVV